MVATKQSSAPRAESKIPAADRCKPFEGRPTRYQEAAMDKHYVQTGEVPLSWTWITTTCGTRCLNIAHMELKAPLRLAYPKSVCIYCGRPAYTQDHLVPRTWSGDRSRSFVVTVPSCGMCNNLINDRITWSLTERRVLAHYLLRRRYRNALAVVEYGPTDIARFEGTLRDEVVRGMQSKAAVQAMLDWPNHDPEYDERACQKSGIESPHDLGLIVPRADAVKAARALLGMTGDIDLPDNSTKAAMGFRTHGKPSTYRLGCRCDDCVEAWANRPRMKAAPKRAVFDD